MLLQCRQIGMTAAYDALHMEMTMMDLGAFIDELAVLS